MRVVIEHARSCHVYSQTASSGLKKERFTMSLESLVKRLADQAIGERVVFLMPEWSFEYASYTIECTSRAVFTVKDLKTIIRDKKEHMRRSHSIAMDGMSHSVVNCRVDGVPVQSLLGKTGDIMFDLHFYVPKVETRRRLTRVTGVKPFTTTAQKKRWSLLPQHLAISRALLARMQTTQGVLMHISSHNAIVLHLSHGSMRRYESSPLGERLLVSCYKEHAIEKYMYANYSEVHANPLLKKLTQESLTFYCHQLAQWMSTQGLGSYPVMLLTNLSKNPLFIPTLQEEYKMREGQGVIMPINSMYQMPDYGSKTYASDACAHAVLEG